jgi:two-component system response regulator HydG
VIILTAFGSFEKAIEATRDGGAFYFHQKNAKDFEQLFATGSNAFRKLELERTVRNLQIQRGGRDAFDNVVTRSPEMKSMFRRLEQVVDSRLTVAIQGESGTGKELVARAIHENSPRAKKPFVAVNCAGIPSTLLESEMFGYEKGAFTGAQSRRAGKFEAADRGTLFLDEVGEMEPALQAKLLRVLQERSFERVGGNEPIHVDVRIITATNKDLAAEVRAGRFRQDLFYRLSVFPVRIPPLRERPEDVSVLAMHFLGKVASEEGRKVKGLTPGAMKRLVSYDYPGNVRQLENAISHAVVVAQGELVDEADLPAYLLGLEGDGLSVPRALGSQFPGFLPLDRILPLARVEELVIRDALLKTRNNVSRAARELGISRVTLIRKRKQYGILKRLDENG